MNKVSAQYLLTRSTLVYKKHLNRVGESDIDTDTHEHRQMSSERKNAL